MKLQPYIEKALSLLRVRSAIGGLEISDAALRFSYVKDGVWQMKSVRVPPGVLQGGHIKDRSQFVNALKTLRLEVFGASHRWQKTSVVVVLSSVNAYTQVFNLPVVQGEALEKAVELNMQMVSPIEISQTHSGWQVVGEDKTALRLEILSAFIDRSVVNELNQALSEGGFFAVALESRALALCRLVREEAAGFDQNRSYIILSLDNTGLDFLVIRRGRLYFEYFNFWRDEVDEKQQISMQIFEATIIRNLHQVLNFYGQHWPEPLTEIILSAAGLSAEVTKIVKDNFSFAVRELTLKTNQQVAPEWFIVLGSALRGLKPREEDREISLLGISASDEFREEQIMHFIRFWRVTIPVALGLLCVVFLLANFFLVRTEQTLEANQNFLGGDIKELETLQAQAREFNQSVALIKSAQQTIIVKTHFFEKIENLARDNGITVVRFIFQAPETPVTFTGKAGSEDSVKSFKKALESDPMFQDIDLPFTSIRKDVNGFSFSVSFIVKL